MTIRMAGLINLQAVGTIPSRVAKESIDDKIVDANNDVNNIEQSVDTAKGNFDKKKAKSTETVVYDEDDAEWTKGKDSPDIKGVRVNERREYDDSDDTGQERAADAAYERKRDAEERANKESEQGKKPGDTWKTANGRTAKKDHDGKITYTEALSNEGVSMPMFREMMKTTERALNLREAPVTLTVNNLRALVKEEYVKILDEQRKGEGKIEKKLYELRDNLIKELFKRTSTTKESVGRAPMVKTLQLATVSKLVDVPVNELTLYFLNHVKSSQNHHLIEYHLGHVHFYAN